jgi:Flp pilus assembly protein TadB
VREVKAGEDVWPRAEAVKKQQSRRRLHKRKQLRWWRRPIDESKLGIFGTRAGALLLIGVIIAIISTPWLLFLVLSVIAGGILFSVVLRFYKRDEALSLFKPRGNRKR